MIFIFLIITLIVSYFISKRLKKTGCIGFGYVTMLVGCVFSFTVAVFFMISIVVSDIVAIPFGTKYIAEVVDYIEDNDDEGIAYFPVVKFTTDSGKVITEKLSFSSGDLEKSYPVNYNEETGKLVVLGFVLALKIVATILFGGIFIFASVGVTRYALGKDMSGYYEILATFFFKFFFPFMIIAFDALLIYALFYGNEVSFFVSVFLVLGITVLTILVLELIKPQHKGS